MMETVTSGKTLVRHPEGASVEVIELPPAGVTKRRDGTAASGTQALLEGLRSDPNITLADAFAISPPASSARRAADKAGPAQVEVEVGANELAAVLIEQHGVFTWRLPEDGTPAAKRRGGAAATRRKLVFRLGEAAPTAPAKRRNLIDFVKGQIVERIRVYVVKLAARATVDAAARFLERSVAPGLIAIADETLDDWRVSERPASVPLPADRPARLLLLVHGTFSSTRGGFGALAITREGKAFLKAARGHYDAILAFDHATLSETPEANAQAILDALEKLALRKGTHLDIVAHSRGGLVARVLVERLIEAGKSGASTSGIEVGKVVFVGSTNGGTALADRENWKALLDLYTNLAVAAGRGLAIFDAGAASAVLTESVRTLGAFVQAVVDAGITDEMTPGLSAMAPKSGIIAALNARSAQPDGAKTRYYAIGSDFKARLVGSSLKSLPQNLMQALADFGVDRLMRESNDLVVDTEAMTQFGGRKNRLAASLLWDANAVIYHTNYFAQPDVARALGAWLLEQRDDRAVPVVAQNPPVLPAALPVRDALARLAGRPGGEVVVIDRPPYGHYVRTAGYIRSAIREAAPEAPLDAALDLRETQRAEPVMDRAAAPQKIGASGWVRFVGGVPTEAVPPPLPPIIEEKQEEEAQAVAPQSPSPARRTRGRALPPVREIDGLVRPDTASPSLLRPSQRGGGQQFDNIVANIKEATRGARKPSPPTVATRSGEAEVKCYFGAQMPASCPLSETAELVVAISREEIEKLAGVTARDEATVRPDRPITLDVRAKSNCEVEGEATVEAPAPAPGREDRYVFRIRGRKAGTAEVWVSALQGRRLLTRLALQPVFTDEGTLEARTLATTERPEKAVVELRVIEEVADLEHYRLRFILQSSDLALGPINETHEVTRAKNKIVKDFYAKMESDWGEDAKEFDVFFDQVRTYGAALYNDLVPQRVKDALWKRRDEIGCIQVFSQEPSIPWELLYLTEPDGAISGDGRFLGELGLVRWLDNIHWPPSSLKARKGRAFYVIPDYADPGLTLAGAADEAKMMKELFSAAEVEGTRKGVVARLQAGGEVDLLHFACHGAADENQIWNAGLQMRGETRASGSFREEALTLADIRGYARFAADGASFPIVFVNACQAGKAGRSLTGTGGLADAFLTRGVGLFVSTLWSIGDDVAGTFANVFYKRLLDGESVTQATRAAREASRKAAEPTWLAYTVYGHPYARLSL
jgi:hypothetical protein